MGDFYILYLFSKFMNLWNIDILPKTFNIILKTKIQIVYNNLFSPFWPFKNHFFPPKRFIINFTVWNNNFLNIQYEIRNIFLCLSHIKEKSWFYLQLASVT